MICQTAGFFLWRFPDNMQNLIPFSLSVSSCLCVTSKHIGTELSLSTPCLLHLTLTVSVNTMGELVNKNRTENNYYSFVLAFSDNLVQNTWKTFVRFVTLAISLPASSTFEVLALMDLDTNDLFSNLTFIWDSFPPFHVGSMHLSLDGQRACSKIHDNMRVCSMDFWLFLEGLCVITQVT